MIEHVTNFCNHGSFSQKIPVPLKGIANVAGITDDASRGSASRRSSRRPDFNRHRTAGSPTVESRWTRTGQLGSASPRPRSRRPETLGGADSARRRR